MALAVLAVLPVGVVVLLVVADQVPQREAVVGHHEVDRGRRPPVGVRVEVGRAGDPGRELTEGSGLPAPVVAHRIAVLAVPLAPQRREVADLVAAVPEVPGLRDQLDLGDHRVLLDDVEERRQLVHLVELPRQGGRQVEAEPVDVHLEHPVAQRVHDQLQHVRAAHQQAVAGAGRVVVVVLGVVHQPVVGRVVEAAEGDRRAALVALGGVVVDHVEDDLDVGLVQRLDHRLELGHLLAVGATAGVGAVRGEEADGVVAPVVRQALVHQVGVVDELVHREQLDSGHAERGEVVDDRRMAKPRVRAPHVVRDARVGHGQALDVGLVEDRLVVLVPRRAVVAPVEEGIGDHRVHRVAERVVAVERGGVAEAVGEQRLVAVDLAVDGLRIGVEQQLARVAAVSVRQVVRPVDPVAVALARLDPRHVSVPDEAVDLDQLVSGLSTVSVDQAELDALGHLREEGEVHAGAVIGRAERVRPPRPDVHRVVPLMSFRVVDTGVILVDSTDSP